MPHGKIFPKLLDTKLHCLYEVFWLLPVYYFSLDISSRYFSFFLHGPASWIVPIRADLGAQVSYGVFVAEKENAEFQGGEYAAFWSRLGKTQDIRAAPI